MAKTIKQIKERIKVTQKFVFDIEEKFKYGVAPTVENLQEIWSQLQDIIDEDFESPLLPIGTEVLIDGVEDVVIAHIDSSDEENYSMGFRYVFRDAGTQQDFDVKSDLDKANEYATNVLKNGLTMNNKKVEVNHQLGVMIFGLVAMAFIEGKKDVTLT